MVYRLLAFFGELFGVAHPSIILCYHSISTDGWFHAVTPPDFKEQIRLLRSNGYHFISLSELVRHLRERTELPHPFCVITFDDGYSDVLSVRSFLKDEGIKPAIFVLAETENVSRSEIGTDRQFMYNDDIRALAEDGWDIGCHGARHKNLARADNASLQHEIIHAREMLKKELDLSIDYFAYPFGAYAYQSLAYVRRGGYKAALSMDDSLVISRGKTWKLPRIGVNGTYSLSEFHDAIAPLPILFRKIIKTVF